MGFPKLSAGEFPEFRVEGVGELDGAAPAGCARRGKGFVEEEDGRVVNEFLAGEALAKVVELLDDVFKVKHCAVEIC